MRTTDKRNSFFKRLLYAFFLGGFLPFLAMSVAFSASTTQILEDAYRRRAEEATKSAAALTSQLLDEAVRSVEELAASEAVIEYAAGSDKSSALVSEANKLLSSFIGATSFSPYVVPGDGSAPLSRGPVPAEYSIPLYEGWGILGELSRAEVGGGAVLFAQPHQGSGPKTPLAAGIRIFAGDRPVGYLVVDIGREVFASRIGLAANSGGALTSLAIADRSGCILYNMTDETTESSFLDTDALRRKDEYTATASVRSGMKVVGAFPYSAGREYAGRVVAMTSILAAASALAFLAMAIILSKSISRPVHALTVTMDRVSRGQLDASCPELSGRRSGDELAALIRDFNRMIAKVNDLVSNKVAQERELRQAEARALQAQINPHFLYNTLNAIRSAAKLEGSQEIAGITTRLAKIMREGSFPGDGFSTVKHSLEIARDYFAIESWRWPGRFKLEESVDPALLDARMPRLILQPLVENALSHGLEGKQGGGLLTIRGAPERGDAVFTISDDGIGMGADRLERIRELLRRADETPFEPSLESRLDEDAADPGPGKTRNGIALINTHRRLRLIYGPPYGIEIASEDGSGTTVTVRFPLSPGGIGSC